MKEKIKTSKSGNRYLWFRIQKYHETGEFDTNEIYPYITEGIGEDILPKNVDFSLIDHFEKVTDKDAAIMARRLAGKSFACWGIVPDSAVAGLNQMKMNSAQMMW